jgi:hypothetical protein
MRCLVAGVGSAMGRQPAGAAADVEVEFIGADGTPRREPLSGCWNLAFERVAPLRGLRRSAGSATGRVCSGSPLPVSMWGMSPGWSRDRLMALDADPEVPRGWHRRGHRHEPRPGRGSVRRHSAAVRPGQVRVSAGWGVRCGARGQLALAVRLPSSPVRSAGAGGPAGRGVRRGGAAAGRGGRGRGSASADPGA